MTPAIDLLVTGASGSPPDWPHGEVVAAPAAEPAALARSWAGSGRTGDAVLCWDPTLGPPPGTDLLTDLLAEPDDAWHAGLALGQAGRPSVVDAVTPTWMLNADAPVDRESTSWRLSLRACLVRRWVIERHGFVDPGFVGLGAAGLELGHRWIQAGVRARHVPALAEGHPPAAGPAGSVDDEVRFAVARFGPAWALWAAIQCFGPARGARAWRRSRARARVHPVVATDRAGGAQAPTPPPAIGPESEPPSVTVLVPTLDRYPYLDAVLTGLRRQSRPAEQVVVVDQTPADRRAEDLADRWPDLPLTVLTLDRPGQSTARNAGLAVATSTHVLFLDDDDELPDGLVEGHVRCHREQRVDASCGVAPEPGRALPAAFRHRRPADVLPTNNTMVAAAPVEAVGRFRPAFDHGTRADHDLGMRLHLDGARLLLEPGLSVVHHRAPSGGLRRYGARAVTTEDSRGRLWARERLEATEHLLWDSYYRPDQVRMAERLWVAGNFRSSRGHLHQVGRAACQLVRLPSALAAVRRARRGARALAEAQGT